MVRLCFLIKIQTKLKLGIVNFFIGDEPDQLWRKNVLFLLQVFYWFWGFFYVLTYYFSQILGNAPLIIVKINHKNTLLLSTITKQYFFFYNFYHYSITELSTSIKHIDKISNYTVI